MRTLVSLQFKRSPFMSLLDLEMAGIEAPLVFTIGGKQYEIPFKECVEPAGTDMILGDPWFRLFVVLHDLSDLDHPRMGLGRRKSDYKLAVSGATSTSQVDTHPVKICLDRKITPSVHNTSDPVGMSAMWMSLNHSSRVDNPLRLARRGACKIVHACMWGANSPC